MDMASGLESSHAMVTRMTSSHEAERHLRRFSSEHPHERDRALTWLLEHADESRPTLVELVRVAAPSAVTSAAIHVLGRMGHPPDVPLLADVLARGERSLTWDAAQALALHRAPEAVAALLSNLRHDDVDVIGAAAVALGLRGDEVARPALEALLDHPSEAVRYRAVSALKRLGAGASAARLRARYAAEPSEQVRQLIADVTRPEALP
jgi:HEAT repeat protein